MGFRDAAGLSLQVLAALGLLACGGKKGTVPPTPPPAPAELTTPHEDESDDEDDFDEEDDADLDADDGGFGSAPAKADAPAPETTPPTAWMKDASKKITAHAKGKTRAWNRLAEMTDTYGHRLSGSKSLESAIDWTVSTMKADGLDNVHKEKVMVPRWVRGRESLSITSPVKRDLTMIGLGMSVGTKGTMQGELAVVQHIDELAKMPKDVLKGKIVLINQVMPAYDEKQHNSHYGPTVRARTSGASEAARMGAKAVLVRSVTATSLNTPHTGSLRYDDDVKKIPAAAVSAESADFLQRSVVRGPVKVSLSMGARMLPDAPSANVIAEVTGREKPDEVVVIGGHIDSWDVGTGASDDGSGCMMAMEAALMLKELELIPKRTIRVVLFTNEENGLRGAKGYFEAHGKETHVGAIEADAGSGAPWGFSIASKDEAQVAQLVAYRSLFKGIGADNISAGWGGADISPLTEAGVLSMAVRPDGSHYFDLHHSPADTIDKIDPAALEGNAAAMALMAYIIAER